ncbi:hypothetical protein JL720_5897 [Aureococcus anophagefferens]|nr:hypothetical protein JL720_5897 [Aureococcus anophagefferens]
MAPNEDAVGAPMCSPDAATAPPRAPHQDAVGAPPRSPDAAAAAPRAAPPPAWEARLARDVAALGGDLGLILGPCGCGKSRLLRRLARVVPLGPGDWAEDRSVVSQMGATPELATGRLSSVGLNSVPTWLRPYGSLSNGERQRAALARRLGHGVGVDDRRRGRRADAALHGRRGAIARAATVAARPETKAQLQTGPVAYRALAGAPKLVDLGDVAARSPRLRAPAPPELRFCREVSLTSRVAVDAHARAASAAFDYAHDGAVSTTVVFPPFDEAGDGAVFGVPRSGYAVGAVSGPSGSGKSTLLRGEFSGKAPLPPQPPGATVFEAVRAQAAAATPRRGARPRAPRARRLWGVADWRALSRGERSLVDVARHLRDGAVLDEFCTGVDARTAGAAAGRRWRSAAGSLGARLRDGLGLGPLVSAAVAALHFDAGILFYSRTSHPRLAAHRDASGAWRPTQSNGKVPQASYLGDRARPGASHVYVGESDAARRRFRARAHAPNARSTSRPG